MDAELRNFPHIWKDLLRGGKSTAVPWIESLAPASVWPCALTILAGSGAYGASIGVWQGPLMALYVGIKLPLIIFATLSVNALLNGILSQILGTDLSQLAR